MKSLALSLLVALGVSLGAATAFAEDPRPEAVLAAAQASMQQAQAHQARAAEYRIAWRVASDKARAAQIVAENDAKQGFSYEAGVEREKAAKYQQEAQADLTGAAREEMLATQYRNQAGRQMVHYQQMVREIPAARR